MKQTAFLFALLFSAAHLFALDKQASQSKNQVQVNTSSHSFAKQEQDTKGEGWCFDLGGAYTWMSWSTPPTYSGSTGGILGRITYQKPHEFFGQLRSVYNIGPLSSSLNHTSFSEWDSEFVGGYCFQALTNWTITPYAGIGVDFLSDHHTSYSSIASIYLKYKLYYALFGFDTHYNWRDWMFGAQIDCFPTFNQYLHIKTLSGSAWTLHNRVGAAVRLPIAYRYAKNFWLELTPYYRFLPIGNSTALGLPERNLNQWGAFLTFRFFL